jgi:hypothetical protein
MNTVADATNARTPQNTRRLIRSFSYTTTKAAESGSERPSPGSSLPQWIDWLGSARSHTGAAADMGKHVAMLSNSLHIKALRRLVDQVRIKTRQLQLGRLECLTQSYTSTASSRQKH